VKDARGRLSSLPLAESCAFVAPSIPSNIGEGSRRKRRKAFLYHLDIALGSQGEADVQLEIAVRLGYCAEPTATRERVNRVGRMLNGLIESLQPQPSDWA